MSTQRLKHQPKYKIGQMAWIEIETEDKFSGLKFKNNIQATISVIKASGTDRDDTYEYGLTTDIPGCYHNGKPPFIYLQEIDVKIEKL